MNVRKLIEMLKSFDPNDEVYFQYPSGDYWRTVLAESVDSVDICGIEYSDYHQKYKVLERDAGGGAYELTEEEAIAKAEKIKEVVLLS